MIKGTTANCKIKSITVTDSTATITCIIYSLSPAKEHKAFKFYLRDKDKDKSLIDLGNVYWIDRINNYNNDSTNIDVNQYLDTQFFIDITNKNTAEIIENKWVRHCNLILKELNNNSDSYAWISEDLTLVSKEFEVPAIYDLNIFSNQDYNLFVNFKYKYKSQSDFNYNNKHLYTTVKVLSVYTETLLDSLDLELTSTNTEAKFLNTFNTQVKIVIELKNNRGQILYSLEKIYNPIIKKTNTFIKTSKGIQRVLAYYIKDNTIYNDVVPLNTEQNIFKLRTSTVNKAQKNSLSLKVNFNNAVVKQPELLKPEFFIINNNTLKIKNLNVSNFTNNNMFLYINNNLVASSTTDILTYTLSDELDNLENLNLILKLQGTSSYINKELIIEKTIALKLVCSETYTCSDYTICKD